jgi:hypothetical protein
MTAGSLLLAAAPPPVPPAWPVSLVDVAREAGLVHPSVYGGVDAKRFILETNGAGVAWLDYDGDGWLDALVLSGTRLREGARVDAVWPAGQAPTNRLYRNRGNGTFADVTEAAGLVRTAWSSSVCAGDFDNDGQVDVFLTAYGQNVLYRNRGGRFEDVTARAGLGGRPTRWGAGCTFVDYDRDGRLDLFVANYLAFDLAQAPEPGKGPNCLWKGVPVNCGPKGLPTDTNLLFHNEGDGRFADVSLRSGVSKVQGRYAMTATAADFDDDGWPDVYVACDSTPSILYRNNRDGTFTDTGVESGLAYGELGTAQAGMGLGLGDVDGDGRLDVLKTHFADDLPSLYRALGRGLYEDTAVAAGLGAENRYVQWGAGLPDLDNDGRADVVIVTGNVYPEIEARMPHYPHRSPRLAFRNTGGPALENVSATSGPGILAVHSSRGAAFGDYDNDGDVDVLVMNMNEPPSLLRNDTPPGRGWLEVLLEGAASNRAAIGATVTVTVGGRKQTRVVASQSSYYSHDDRRLHFGLGDAARADAVEVRWPSGRVEVLKDVPGRQVLKVRESPSL